MTFGRTTQTLIAMLKSNTEDTLIVEKLVNVWLS